MARTDLIVRNKIFIEEHFAHAEGGAPKLKGEVPSSEPAFFEGLPESKPSKDIEAALRAPETTGLFEHFMQAAGSSKELFEHFLTANRINKGLLEHFLVAQPDQRALFADALKKNPHNLVPFEHFLRPPSSSGQSGAVVEEHFTFTLPRPQMVSKVSVRKNSDGTFIISLEG